MTTASPTSFQSAKLTTAQRLLFKALNRFQHGSLTLHDGDATFVFGNPDGPGPHASAQVHTKQVYREMLTGGALAAAECYVAGFWDTSDLTQVVRVFAANVNTTSKLNRTLGTLTRPLLRLSHWLNRNDRNGSRRNIRAHYDLGNDLFETFLDESMMYSSAIYPRADASLEEAQTYRLDRICQKLALGPEDHLLEIGTGWGGLAIHAARHYGCRVTTTTISEEQFHYARERIHEAGLDDRITLLKEDYRDLTGRYDKIVSIEMIEAVGHDYLPSYFNMLSDRLADNGSVLLQCITMPDQRYDQYRKSVDFIRKYIFPGGHLPSVSVLMDNLKRHTDMQLVHLEDITDHYARTLNDWHQRFNAAKQQLQAQGYDETFIRLWRYYFAYCEGGFTERAIATHQLMFAKSGNQQTWTPVIE
ncbi:SAM-dependent methyltransferase [Saccharospirillum salsuginis]|uniref:Cyclopropane-fatty-acyl-phospholipid synthase n=1 Tax=Saccharospirillum salsuginis TaxID=418750 RepID=A0A918NBU7_9GAMM|nr:cyclopropane-fatty-acyl-phospholipid synthase family protein [Saccharospirillum salsuginis]GGX61018.1 cyclopropane-fatty-acyl-phospholipid synthase [Saccharospirillum salsuginis]